MATIESINCYRPASINPSNSPDGIFEVYSVPTFFTGKPENLVGKEIGSTKQLVRKGDVLLCKINPHLNRVWEVNQISEHPQIASSEWIVIRSKSLDPTFLRYYLESTEFRELLCSQVSGVGGSLTRAQPATVKKYYVPIPPIVEQKAIVDKINILFSILERIKGYLAH